MPGIILSLVPLGVSLFILGEAFLLDNALRRWSMGEFICLIAVIVVMTPKRFIGLTLIGIGTGSLPIAAYDVIHSAFLLHHGPGHLTERAPLVISLLLFVFLLAIFLTHMRMVFRYDASATGRELLNRLLTPAQREEWKTHRQITIPLIGPKGERGDAKIGRDITGVNWRAPHGHAQCVAVSGGLVKEDDIIAKLLWIRTDPRGLAQISHDALTGWRPAP